MPSTDFTEHQRFSRDQSCSFFSLQNQSNKTYFQKHGFQKENVYILRTGSSRQHMRKQEKNASRDQFPVTSE